ncbi:hypothetical protein [Vibrio vulnificus YJ016]|uniref:Uncharacterized protein n=1 Tax=Vibrio vulnificus (strain YJ016) TaxID=196600 RepID=Q7MEY1_VIBVY|nr:hypothetical protein [Vibrio vulnificus YJ016]
MYCVFGLIEVSRFVFCIKLFYFLFEAKRFGGITPCCDELSIGGRP